MGGWLRFRKAGNNFTVLFCFFIIKTATAKLLGCMGRVRVARAEGELRGAVGMHTDRDRESVRESERE